MNVRLRTLSLPLALGVVFAACDDSDPLALEPALTSDATLLEFSTLDPDFGEGLPQSIAFVNGGGVAANIGAATLEGSAAADFRILSTPGASSIGAGRSFEVSVLFDPTTAGDRTATLRLPVENGADVEIALIGTGQPAPYQQVDRMGIPALNTVFNHPPQFSKMEYNLATPDADIANYTGLFETVLGAVANPDPAATAALLLPDALPVSLAGPTSFATLTGRALEDDAVDVALSVTVGVPALQSDNVDSNDRAFLTNFPYLATPNR